MLEFCGAEYVGGLHSVSSCTGFSHLNWLRLVRVGVGQASLGSATGLDFKTKLSTIGMEIIIT